MRIIIERPALEKEIHFHGTVLELLDKEGINPETVLVVRDGRLVALDDPLEDEDVLKILSVISGG